MRAASDEDAARILLRAQSTLITSIAQLSADELTVEAGNVGDAHTLGALGLAGTGVGAGTKAQLVHFRQHGLGAALGFHLALRQESKLAHLGADEQHGRAVLAGSNAGTTADAGSSIHSFVGLLLGDGDGIGIGDTTGVDADIAARSHDLVEGTTVNHKVANDGEAGRTPRLDGDDIAVLETAHVDLACGGTRGRAMGMTIDIERAHAADAFAAVVVEDYGFLAAIDEHLVQDVKHLEERGVARDVFHVVALELAFLLRTTLTPHLQCKTNILVHFVSIY